MKATHFRWVLAAIVLLGTWIVPPAVESQEGCEPDETPPDITCPPDITLDCGSPTDPGTTGMPTAMDDCDTSPATIFTDVAEPGACPGSQRITRTWTATDDGGNTASCTQTISVECCSEPFCSLTQGAYGKARGRFNGEGTLALLERLLVTPVLVGLPGRSLTFDPESARCVIDRLPAGGRPSPLLAIGDETLRPPECQTQPPLPLIGGRNDRKPGRFRNVLLGQALTLSLNVRLDPDLADFGLCNLLVTQLSDPGPDGLRGTGDDVVDPGPDGVPGTADDTLTLAIPVSVTNALSALDLSLDVNGLVELANRALAGEPTAGASLGDINRAADAINSGFDECRFLLECGLAGP